MFIFETSTPHARSTDNEFVLLKCVIIHASSNIKRGYMNVSVKFHWTTVSFLALTQIPTSYTLICLSLRNRNIPAIKWPSITENIPHVSALLQNQSRLKEVKG